MKKIILLFIGVLLLYSANVFAQGTSMTIGSVSAGAGATVDLPINVANFNNVGAISLKISYDTTALTFVGIANSPANVTFTKNATGGILILGWFDATASSPINISSGKLVDLLFSSNGNAGSVNFVTTGINPCQISDETGKNISVTFNNGGVTAGPSVKLSIGSLQAISGTNISVPLNSSYMPNVGSISLKVDYNPAVLTYIGITNELSGVTFTASGSNGVISISWYDSNPPNNPINIDSVTKLLNLNFTYNGGSSALSFDTANSDVANELGIKYNSNIYSNGLVYPYDNSNTTFQIGTISGSTGAVSVPVTAKSYNSIGAISLKIDYNSSLLTFSNVTSALKGITFTTSASNGVLSISWFDATGSNPITIGNNDTLASLLNINFTANTGTSAITFDTANSEIANDSGIKITGVAYVNGSVTATTAATNPTLTLASVTGTVGSIISVPLTVQKFSNIGAVSLKINYNATAVTFDSVSTTLGKNFTASASNGVITISWFDASATSPINLDSNKTLLKLNFLYNGGASSLVFNTASSEIANESGTALSNVTYVNGSITSSGPVIQIANVISAAGGVVKVPVFAEKFSAVGAISLKIDFTSTALSFDSLSNAPAGMTFTTKAVNGVLSISWFDPTGGSNAFNTDSTQLFTLYFNYAGGSSNLNFETANSEFANSKGIAINNVDFINGSVRTGLAPKVSLPNVPAIPGETLSIPITVQSFNDIGAVSFQIQYNSAVITYTNYSNAFGGNNFHVTAKNGVITVSWFDATGGSAPIVTAPSDSATLLNLNFTYAAGNSGLTFITSTAEISDQFGDVISGGTYVNGSVFADQPPVFTNVIANGTSFHWSAGFSFQYKATTVSGNALTFSLVKEPTGSAIVAGTGVYSLTPKAIGSDTIIVSVSDGLLTTDTTSVLSVTDQAPVFTKQLTADTTLAYGKTFQFLYNASDPDKDTFTFSLVQGPLGAAINKNGLFSWTPKVNNQGANVIVIGVSDGMLTTTSTTTFNIVAGIAKKDGIPTTYALYQNYPNPFNPSTTINFDVPKESKVVLKVYNILGQEVATLVNEKMVAGSYSYQFSEGNLSSGMYIYRLQAGDYTLTKKMTLLK
jgi:hypothetical protein